MGINRTERVEIFEDTKRLVKENEKLKKAVEYSNAHQTLIPESEDIAVKADRYEKEFYCDSLRRTHVIEHKRFIEDTRGVLQLHQL